MRQTDNPTLPPPHALLALDHDMWRRRISRPPSRADRAKWPKQLAALRARGKERTDTYVPPHSPQPVFDLFSVYEVTEALDRQHEYHRDRHPW